MEAGGRRAPAAPVGARGGPAVRCGEAGGGNGGSGGRRQQRNHRCCCWPNRRAGRGEGTGRVLLVAPMLDLAVRVQRKADALWPTGAGAPSLLLVVGVDERADGAAEDDDLVPGRSSLLALGCAPLIAVTPKMLRALYNAAAEMGTSGRGGARCSRRSWSTRTAWCWRRRRKRKEREEEAPQNETRRGGRRGRWPR